MTASTGDSQPEVIHHCSVSDAVLAHIRATVGGTAIQHYGLWEIRLPHLSFTMRLGLLQLELIAEVHRDGELRSMTRSLVNE